MLTADELCVICRITPAQRQAWAKEGDLRRRRGFEELDALELAVYAKLRGVAGPKRAKSAWRDLRNPLREHFLKPPRHLWAVVETRGVERHALATRPRELSKGVDHGRPVVVVELRQVIDTARANYRDAANRKRRAETPRDRTRMWGS